MPTSKISHESDTIKASSNPATSIDFDDNTENDAIANSDRIPMTAMNPKSGRQYITSFTTTTTIRPTLSRGVEIIRSLVEQARSTPPVPTGSVQSLTTLKTISASKEMTNQTSRNISRTTTMTTTTTKMPTNHRMIPLPSTTRRIPANHQTHDELIKSFTQRPTTTERARHRPQNIAESPINISDIQDLLNKVPITTPRASHGSGQTNRQNTNRLVSISVCANSVRFLKPET